MKFEKFENLKPEIGEKQSKEEQVKKNFEKKLEELEEDFKKKLEQIFEGKIKVENIENSEKKFSLIELDITIKEALEGKGKLEDRILYKQKLLEIFLHPYLRNLNYLERNKKIIEILNKIIDDPIKTAPIISGLIKEVFVKKIFENWKKDIEVILPLPKEDQVNKIDLILISKSENKFLNLQIKGGRWEDLIEILKKRKLSFSEALDFLILPFKKYNEISKTKNYFLNPKELKNQLSRRFFEPSLKLSPSLKPAGGILIKVPFIVPSLKTSLKKYEFELDSALEKMRKNPKVHLDFSGEPLPEREEVKCFQETLIKVVENLLSE